MLNIKMLFVLQMNRPIELRRSSIQLRNRKCVSSQSNLH